MDPAEVRDLADYCLFEGPGQERRHVNQEKEKEPEVLQKQTI
jgi:hypothetical protein